MPIYDFRCQSCGKMFESLVRDVTKKAISCPSYGSQDVGRLVSVSYLIKAGSPNPGVTCCGRTERCDIPPCSAGSECRHDQRS